MTAEKKYLKVSFKKIPCSIFKEILKSNIYTNDEDSVKKKKNPIYEEFTFFVGNIPIFCSFYFPASFAKLGYKIMFSNKECFQFKEYFYLKIRHY